MLRFNKHEAAILLIFSMLLSGRDSVEGKPSEPSRVMR
jgi:hypothetical protein